MGNNCAVSPIISSVLDLFELEIKLIFKPKESSAFFRFE